MEEITEVKWKNEVVFEAVKYENGNIHLQSDHPGFQHLNNLPKEQENKILELIYQNQVQEWK